MTFNNADDNNLDAQVANAARHAAPSTAAVEIAVVSIPTNIFSKAFLNYAGERALKTVFQVALAGLGVSGVTGVLEVSWLPMLSIAVVSGLASVLQSALTIMGRNVGD